MMFGQFPEETQNLMDTAAAHPYDPSTPDAGFFKGIGTGISQGYEAGGAQLLMLGTDAMAGVEKWAGAEQPDPALTDWRKASQSLLSSLSPDPKTVGFAGRMLGGLAQTLPTLAGGALVGGPIGAAASVAAPAGYSDFRLAQGKGVDTTTAALQGGITGLTAGAGALLPVGVGSTVAAKVATGAIGNIIFGAGQREASSALLKARGYPDMAAQYKPLDAASVAADGVLGAAFGGVASLHQKIPESPLAAHAPGEMPSTTQLDAAMMAKNSQNLEVDSAPGVPINSATRMTHIEAMKAATDQLLRGDPVDLSNVIDHDMHFSLDPASPLSSAYKEFSGALKEAGFEDQAADINERVEASEGNFEKRSSKLQQVQQKYETATIEAQQVNQRLQDINDQIASPLSASDKIALVDPDSGERLKGIETNLKDPALPAAQRIALEQQWQMIVDGRDWKEIPGAVAERQERLQTQSAQIEKELTGKQKDIVRYGNEVEKRKTKLQPIPKAEGLNPQQRGIEKAFSEKIAKNYQQAKAEYLAKPETEGGRILNTDTARELSEHYLADRTQSTAVHEPASYFIKKLYAEKLKEAPAEGQDNSVLFMAGGTGAGKTSALRNINSDEVKRAQIIYDTNSNKFESTEDKIEQALAAGKKVKIVYVTREPIDALVNGALPRATRQEEAFGSGRTVPIKEHVNTHLGSFQTIKRIIEKYKGDERVEVHAIDNSHGPGNAREVSIDNLPVHDYNDLHEKLKNAVQQEFEKGTISERTRIGFTGEPTDRADAADAGGANAGTEPQSERIGANSNELAAGAEPQGYKTNAEQIAAEHPNTPIVTGETDKDGNPEVITVAEAIAREHAADQEVEVQKRMVQAAINCFLKWGG